MIYGRRIAEDHRFATAVEVESRSPEELSLLPHLSGAEVQVLCDELAGYVRETAPSAVRLVAPGGTAIFLAQFLASFDAPIETIVHVEPGFDGQRTRAELATVPRVRIVDTVDALRDFSTPCLILAPFGDVVGWAHELLGRERGYLHVLAYDPKRELSRELNRGRYVFGLSRIWCGEFGPSND
jgi:hypothetical protein